MNYNLSETIRPVDPVNIDEASFKTRFADCAVLTRDGKILLQQRTPGWGKSAGCLTAFGGHVEPGETPVQGVIRELHEELGAIVAEADLVLLGAVTEAETSHTEIVYCYFWHDRHGAITGCYECEAVYYDRIAGALAHPKIMDYLRWMLDECRKRQFLK